MVRKEGRQVGRKRGRDGGREIEGGREGGVGTQDILEGDDSRGSRGKAGKGHYETCLFSLSHSICSVFLNSCSSCG